MALAPIIKILLSSLLNVLALVTLQTISSRGVHFAVLAMLVTGAHFVWRLEHATAVAQGRGADLLMYLRVMITCPRSEVAPSV